MDRKTLKRDAERYLAQQRERGSILWSEPASVGPLPSRDDGKASQDDAGAKPVANTPPEELPAATQPPSRPKQAGKPPVERDTVPAGDWPRGAPEPEPTIPGEGVLEDPFPAYTALAEFDQAICNCQKCPLGKSRKNFVFGVGDPNADLLVIGEAPGADEDAQGEPFVGRAGKLLDQILAAVQLKRGDGVYIANILKCRPPNNRDPLPSEVEQCEPHLVKQIQLIKPKLILALGRIAAQTLLRSSEPLSKMRGRLHDYHGVPLMVTFHPAALLRNPNWKRPTWEDVQWMRKVLDERRAGKD